MSKPIRPRSNLFKKERREKATNGPCERCGTPGTVRKWETDSEGDYFSEGLFQQQEDEALEKLRQRSAVIDNDFGKKQNPINYFEKPGFFKYVQKNLSLTAQALVHITISSLLLVMPITLYVTAEEADAKSAEIAVFVTSAVGLAYMSFGIKSWVISVYSDELNLGKLDTDAYDRFLARRIESHFLRPNLDPDVNYRYQINRVIYAAGSARNRSDSFQPQFLQSKRGNGFADAVQQLVARARQEKILEEANENAQKAPSTIEEEPENDVFDDTKPPPEFRDSSSEHASTYASGTKFEIASEIETDSDSDVGSNDELLDNHLDYNGNAFRNVNGLADIDSVSSQPSVRKRILPGSSRASSRAKKMSSCSEASSAFTEVDIPLQIVELPLSENKFFAF